MDLLPAHADLRELRGNCALDAPSVRQVNQPTLVASQLADRGSVNEVSLVLDDYGMSIGVHSDSIDLSEPLPQSR
jgi:hypothetical protein